MSTEPPIAMSLPQIPDEKFTRIEVAGFVTILVSGHPVLGFDRANQAQRDVVIASMVLAGCAGVTVAKLCGVKPSWVTRVKQRYESGGMAALVPKRKKAKKKATPTMLMGPTKERALSMRRRGNGIHTIAEALRVPPAHVRATLIAAGMGPVGRGGRYRHPQMELEGIGASHGPSKGRAKARAAKAAAPRTEPTEEAPTERRVARPRELHGAVELAPDGRPHASRYAGVLLLMGQLGALGVGEALDGAGARRPRRCVYGADDVALAYLGSTVAGFGSMESMHEQDARSLGVLLGRERSPSVRTLHRAMRQMTAAYDVAALGSHLVRRLAESHPRAEYTFGVDGHFVAYDGDAPIDKGWNSKKRIAQRGQLDIVATDENGLVWHRRAVDAGDSLAQHLMSTVGTLRAGLPEGAKIVLLFDRGGIDLDVTNELAAAGVGYVGWLPASVKTCPLERVAPLRDGVGERAFEHKRVAHAARLIVQRDGDALLPVVTNLDGEQSADEVIRLLRRVRGMQENGFKTARAQVRIDHRPDRGVANIGPDTRSVDNPAWLEMRARRDAVMERLATLDSCREPHANPRSARISREFEEMRLAALRKTMRGQKAKVPRSELEPGALRAVLATRTRELVLPLKYAAANAVRELQEALGSGLAPTDAEHDASAVTRTLLALLRAPGTVAFARDHVTVELDFPLPQQPHRRLSLALSRLDRKPLLYIDRRRPLRVRLAPRPQG